MTNMESRIKSAYDKMTIEQRYELMEHMENKNLGANENVDTNFMESITNLLLEGTTIIAKIFKII